MTIQKYLTDRRQDVDEDHIRDTDCTDPVDGREHNIAKVGHVSPVATCAHVSRVGRWTSATCSAPRRTPACPPRAPPPWPPVSSLWWLCSGVYKIVTNAETFRRYYQDSCASCKVCGVVLDFYVLFMQTNCKYFIYL